MAKDGTTIPPKSREAHDQGMSLSEMARMAGRDALEGARILSDGDFFEFCEEAGCPEDPELAIEQAHAAVNNAVAGLSAAVADELREVLGILETYSTTEELVSQLNEGRRRLRALIGEDR